MTVIYANNTEKDSQSHHKRMLSFRNSTNQKRLIDLFYLAQ